MRSRAIAGLPMCCRAAPFMVNPWLKTHLSDYFANLHASPDIDTRQEAADALLSRLLDLARRVSRPSRLPLTSAARGDSEACATA